MCMHHVCAWGLWRSEDGAGSSGDGVLDSRELSCVCWELNPGHLELEQVLLTCLFSLRTVCALNNTGRDTIFTIFTSKSEEALSQVAPPPPRALSSFKWSLVGKAMLFFEKKVQGF